MICKRCGSLNQDWADTCVECGEEGGLEPAIDPDRPDAKYEIGLRYYRGEGAPCIAEEAARWFREAAELGCCYHVGGGAQSETSQRPCTGGGLLPGRTMRRQSMTSHSAITTAKASIGTLRNLGNGFKRLRSWAMQGRSLH